MPSTPTMTIAKWAPIVLVALALAGCGAGYSPNYNPNAGLGMMSLGAQFMAPPPRTMTTCTGFGNTVTCY